MESKYILKLAALGTFKFDSRASRGEIPRVMDSICPVKISHTRVTQLQLLTTPLVTDILVSILLCFAFSLLSLRQGGLWITALSSRSTLRSAQATVKPRHTLGANM